jgi:DNA-binding protein YbaB
MFNKLKQIRDLRSSAKQMQEQLAEIMVVGTARNGIMVTIDGTQTVQGVQIVDGLDKGAIESGVKDAFNDASKKLQKELAVKMRDMGGLDAFKDLLGG